MKNRYFILAGFLLLTLSACGGGESSRTSSVTERPVRFSISVTDLPAELPVNIPEHRVAQIEYNWGIKIDMDGNGRDSDGDILVDLIHNKFFDPEGMRAAASFPTAIYYLDNGLRYLGQAEVSVSGNTITLTVDRNMHSSLSGIDAAKSVKFTSQGTLYGVTYTDRYPDDGSYAPMSPVSSYTDISGDVSSAGTFANVFDLVQLQVSFE